MIRPRKQSRQCLLNCVVSGTLYSQLCRPCHVRTILRTRKSLEKKTVGVCNPNLHDITQRLNYSEGMILQYLADLVSDDWSLKCIYVALNRQ